MSERMPPAEPESDLSRREWWWRRRPPADSSEFTWWVWWAGHLQIALAVVLVAVFLPLFVADLAEPSGDGGGSIAARLSARVGGLQGVILGLAMAGPFALSGRMLRASSGWQLYRRRPSGGGFLRKAGALVASVLGIALISVVLTACVVWVLVIVVDAAGRLSGG